MSAGLSGIMDIGQLLGNALYTPKIQQGLRVNPETGEYQDADGNKTTPYIVPSGWAKAFSPEARQVQSLNAQAQLSPFQAQQEEGIKRAALGYQVDTTKQYQPTDNRAANITFAKYSGLSPRALSDNQENVDFMNTGGPVTAAAAKQATDTATIPAMQNAGSNATMRGYLDLPYKDAANEETAAMQAPSAIAARASGSQLETARNVTGIEQQPTEAEISASSQFLELQRQKLEKTSLFVLKPYLLDLAIKRCMAEGDRFPDEQKLLAYGQQLDLAESKIKQDEQTVRGARAAGMASEAGAIKSTATHEARKAFFDELFGSKATSNIITRSPSGNLSTRISGNPTYVPSMSKESMDADRGVNMPKTVIRDKKGNVIATMPRTVEYDVNGNPVLPVVRKSATHPVTISGYYDAH